MSETFVIVNELIYFTGTEGERRIAAKALRLASKPGAAELDSESYSREQIIAARGRVEDVNTTGRIIEPAEAPAWVKR